MSEKHLTAQSWKECAGTHKVKETKVAEALADLANCAEGNTEARIEALAVVKKEAEALKQKQKANLEVATYLGEMLKEVEKNQKAADLLKKESKEKLPVQAKPEEEKKGAGVPIGGQPRMQIGVRSRAPIDVKLPVKAKPEEEKKGAREKEEKKEVGDPIPPNSQFKGLLTGAMGKVKARQPTDPPMGAMLCQLGDKFGVFLSGNVGSAQQTLLTQVFPGTGHKFAKGTCEWGKGDIYTFVLSSPLAGAARGLKRFFLERTGVSYKIRVGTPEKMEEDLTEVKLVPQVGVKPGTQAPTGAKPGTQTPTGAKPGTQTPTGAKPGTQAPTGAKPGTQTPVGAKPGPQIGGKPGPQIGAKPGPQIGVKTEPQIGVKTGPQIGVKTGPQIGAKQTGTETKPPDPLRISMKVTKEWKDGKAAAEKGIASLKAAILQQCDPELEAQVKAKIDVWDSILGLVDDKFLKQLTATALAESDEENQTQHALKAAETAAKIAMALKQHSLAAAADDTPFGRFFICGALNRMLTHVQALFKGGA